MSLPPWHIARNDFFFCAVEFLFPFYVYFHVVLARYQLGGKCSCYAPGFRWSLPCPESLRTHGSSWLWALVFGCNLRMVSAVGALNLRFVAVVCGEGRTVGWMDGWQSGVWWCSAPFYGFSCLFFPFHGRLWFCDLVLRQESA